MNLKALKSIIRKGESQQIEFKESLALKDEIGETVSAFANTNNGSIIIGISDMKIISGIDIGKHTIEELANYIKQHTDPQMHPKIETIVHKHKMLLMLFVNEHDEKPVFFKGRAFVRTGKSNHRMSASEIKKFVKESSKIYWDEQLCKNSTYQDIDIKKVKSYIEQKEKYRKMSTNSTVSIDTFLENINALHNHTPTNAGILFFGKNPTKYLLQAQLRVILIKGTDVTGDILDRIDCEGSLPEMIDQAELFLRKHIELMGRRTDKSFQREDKYNIPIKAVRELVINAVIHRDYESSADVRVFVFDDRIEIINPGHFPKGVNPQYPKHVPVNKLVSQYMYDIGYIEKYGSGITNVRKMLSENGNSEQKYSSNELETITRIYKQKPLKTTPRAKVAISSDKVAISSDKLIIEYLTHNKVITNEVARNITGLSPAGVRKIFVKFTKNKIITPKGKGKHRTYTIKILED